MRLERYMIARDLMKGTPTKTFLVYSSHRTPEKAFQQLDKIRRDRKLTELYVRDKFFGKRAKRPTQGKGDSHGT